VSAYRAGEIAALRSIITAWMRLAMFEAAVRATVLRGRREPFSVACEIHYPAATDTQCDRRISMQAPSGDVASGSRK